jgi:predicted adenine nucleotide alpha hydrolase (AANH) superfamily ATPase
LPASSRKGRSAAGFILAVSVWLWFTVVFANFAEAMAEEAGVPFLYRDFRTGWAAGIAGSKALGLYRQNYCGCLFSERDRYLGASGKKTAQPEGEG